MKSRRKRGIPVLPSSHVMGGGGGADQHRRRLPVWAINRGGLFAILAVEEAHRWVLIKLWECSVLWLIVFPFHSLSTIRTSVLLQYDMGPFISCCSNTKCNSMRGGVGEGGGGWTCGTENECFTGRSWNEEKQSHGGIFLFLLYLNKLIKYCVHKSLPRGLAFIHIHCLFLFVIHQAAFFLGMHFSENFPTLAKGYFYTDAV